MEERDLNNCWEEYIRLLFQDGKKNGKIISTNEDYFEIFYRRPRESPNRTSGGTWRGDYKEGYKHTL